ncbi:MAG: nitroreductase [Pseudomonadales bacterium]|nr:nitroreductase [Pseudomonadales bacterium]
MSLQDPQMSLVEAINRRRSVRGFLDRPVPEEVLQRVFELAQLAPSNCNVQPWKVYVATGQLCDTLRKQMVQQVLDQVPPNPDYEYRGDFVNEYRRRQVDCAVALYTEMGIERGDKAGRERAVLRNFEFFDAPCIAFLGMSPDFGTTVAIDVGMYAQNLMLALVAYGLHSCSMGSMRNYPDLVRKAFNIEDGTRILFGMAIGYEDTSVPANRTRVGREPITANVLIRSQAQGEFREEIQGELRE